MAHYRLGKDNEVWLEEVGDEYCPDRLQEARDRNYFADRLQELKEFGEDFQRQSDQIISDCQAFSNSLSPAASSPSPVLLAAQKARADRTPRSRTVRAFDGRLVALVWAALAFALVIYVVVLL